MSKYSHFEMCEKIFGDRYKWDEHKQEYTLFTRSDMWDKLVEQQQQIAELQKQLERHNKYFNSFSCDSFDEFTDFISTFMLTPHEEQTLIKDLKKQLGEKNKIIQMQQDIERYDIGEMLTENTKLRQQLKSQPAEIVEKIRNLAEKDFDFDTCTCCGEDVHDDVVLPKSDFNKILDKVLKKYGEK
jgi:hypothetical protein